MDTQAIILQVAQNLFARQGYTATSMRQVAEEAGIGKATIYHHFVNKEALLMTLIKDNVAQMVSALDLVRAETEPRQRIRVAAEASMRFLYDSAVLLQIARREVSGARQLLLSHVPDFFKQYEALLVEAFNKGMEMKIFRPINPHETARVFMTLIQGNFAMLYILGERAETPEKAAERLLDIFFNGINAAPR